MKHRLLLGPVALLIASLAQAQSFNLRYAAGPALPSPTFGAAIGQAGHWNGLNTPNWRGAVSTSLIDLSGAATGVTAVLQGCDAYSCSVQEFGPEYAALFAGMVNGDCYADPSTTRLFGLQAGHYVITAYPAPCVTSLHQVHLKTSDLLFQKFITIGGSFSGSFSSLTLGHWEFDLAPGASVTVSGGTFGYLSALQVTRVEPPSTYCTAKINSEGCAASIASSGGLGASLSSPAPFMVDASQVLTNAVGILFYGHAADIKPFQGGFHCIKTPTPRTPAQFSGNQGAPCTGTFSFDFNAWLQFGTAQLVYPGTPIHAQYWYRDPNDPLGFGAATSDAARFWVLQ